MSLLNEALRKSVSKGRIETPYDLPLAKTINTRKTIYIGAVVVMAAVIGFCSMFIHRTVVKNIPLSEAATPPIEQKNPVAPDNSPMTGNGEVNNAASPDHTMKKTAISVENKIMVNEHPTVKAAEADQAQKPVEGTPAPAVSAPKTAEASEKKAPAIKVKPKAAANKISPLTDPTQEDQATVADRFYQKALQFHRDGRIEEAIGMYREVLKYTPDNPGAKYNLSSAYIEVSRYSEAYDILNSLLASDPENPEIQLNLAVAEIGMARPADAVDLLRRIDTGDKKLRFSKFLHLGVAASQMGKLDEALTYYKQAEGINDGLSKLIYNMAVTNDKLGNYKEAIAYYRKFLTTGSSTQAETSALKDRIMTLSNYISGTGN